MSLNLAAPLSTIFYHSNMSLLCRAERKKYIDGWLIGLWSIYVSISKCRWCAAKLWFEHVGLTEFHSNAYRSVALKTLYQTSFGYKVIGSIVCPQKNSFTF